MSRLVYPYVPAIAHARKQSENGPPFEVGMCLMETEIAFFGEHGFGGDTAANGWDLCKHKHPFKPGVIGISAFLRSIPRGFPIWFKGGTPTVHHPEGAGHITISGTPDNNWSVDRKRAGYWDRVTVEAILTWNSTHPLKLLGWSEDIGGRRIPYMPHSKDAHR
ncbi:MAG TPA: hypothetical protein VIY48_22130 [Candidatus Paceibacterota bacterium]